jgi:hypothetical protein
MANSELDQEMQNAFADDLEYTDLSNVPLEDDDEDNYTLHNVVGTALYCFIACRSLFIAFCSRP